MTFGYYEQDNRTDNGKEPVSWIVLKVENDQALLISEKNLDCKPYNEQGGKVTWETCLLRAWLSNKFLKTTFTTEEQKAIQEETVNNDDNPEYGTEGGRDTSDKVFLISISEAESLFKSDSARIAQNTDYVTAQGGYPYNRGYDWWWMRSPGCVNNHAALVTSDGSVWVYGNYVYIDFIAVRPALYINLNMVTNINGAIKSML